VAKVMERLAMSKQTNFDDDVGINTVWETTGENKNFSQR
jgi:hypothetical protein